MPPLAAKRENLVSPLNLALMVGVFALAFFLLKPESVPSTQLGERLLGDISNTIGKPVDELELAYLKALKSSGKIEDTDVAAVALRFLRNERFDDASSLLNTYPELQLSEALRFELDLQLAVVQSESTLVSAIEHFLSTNRLHKPELVQQALRLSKTLPQPALTLGLYHLAAIESTDSAYVIYRECGDYFVSRVERTFAVTCYQQALDSLEQPADGFDVELSLLLQLDFQRHHM